MDRDGSGAKETVALSTKVEEEFIAPLTAIRGSLEILRDFDDLSKDERTRFLDTALRGCVRLEKAVAGLAESVYDAGGETGHTSSASELSQDEYREYASRVHILDDLHIIEIDFSSFVFKSSKIVNDFHNVIDGLIATTGRDWYFVVNYRDCRIWPEAWVAFAHRGKKINVTHSLGTVRYVEREADETKVTDEPLSASYDPNLFDSRDAAFARIAELKRSAGE